MFKGIPEVMKWVMLIIAIVILVEIIFAVASGIGDVSALQ